MTLNCVFLDMSAFSTLDCAVWQCCQLDATEVAVQQPLHVDGWHGYAPGSAVAA